MQTSDFNYKLDESLIAKNPPQKRGNAKLLVLNRQAGSIKDDFYYNLDKYLSPGDLVILNNTKVLPARLKLLDNKSKEREILILERHHKKENWFNHDILFRGSLKEKDILKTKDQNEIIITKVLGEGLASVSSKVNLLDLANQIGEVPLPPYLKRNATKEDRLRYQTVWAKEIGSVAAPTASLNMTSELLEKLKNKGVKIVYATLHVGIGTFLPIRVDDLNNHKMHKEYFEIPKETVEAIKEVKRNSKKVIAIGTTIARSLEYCGNKLLDDKPKTITGEADIFIYPGYEFRVLDGLLTNFHAPKSTVLMLASAFGGWDNLSKAYQHAISNGYRFLSYGDSMLII